MLGADRRHHVSDLRSAGVCHQRADNLDVTMVASGQDCCVAVMVCQVLARPCEHTLPHVNVRAVSQPAAYQVLSAPGQPTCTSTRHWSHASTGPLSDVKSRSATASTSKRVISAWPLVASE